MKRVKTMSKRDEKEQRARIRRGQGGDVKPPKELTLPQHVYGCSFCGATEGKTLIQGPAVAICDECIVQAVSAIADICRERGRLLRSAPKPRKAKRGRAGR